MGYQSIFNTGNSDSPGGGQAGGYVSLFGSKTQKAPSKEELVAQRQKQSQHDKAVKLGKEGDALANKQPDIFKAAGDYAASIPGSLVKGAGDALNTFSKPIGNSLATPQVEGALSALNQAHKAGAIDKKGLIERANQLTEGGFVDKKLVVDKNGARLVDKNPLEFAAGFANAGVNVASVLPVAGGAATGVKAGLAGGKAVAGDIAKQAVVNNAKQAAVYGTAATANQAAQGTLTPESAANNYAAPFALGVAGEVGGRTIASKFSKTKPQVEAVDIPSSAKSVVTPLPESRQLNAGKVGQQPAVAQNAKLIAPLEVNTRLGVRVDHPVPQTFLSNLDTIDKHILEKSQATGFKGPEARDLMKQRQFIVDQIQNHDTAVKSAQLLSNKEPTIAEVAQQDPGRPANEIQAQIEQAHNSGDNQKASVLISQLPPDLQSSTRNALGIPEVIPADKLPPQTGTTRISSAARNTEALAIKNNLSDGFDNLPTYEKDNLAQNAGSVVDYMNADYEATKKIALGQQASPGEIPATAFYEGVKNRAVKEGDAETIRQLATESTVPSQATKYGQFNAALAYRDSTNPVVALQDIAKARKESALAIPREITPEEATKVTNLAQSVAKAKDSIVEGNRDSEMAYGYKLGEYQDYVNGLKDAAKKKSLKDYFAHPSKNSSFTEFAGITKSLRAALDNSILLRQGFKTLLTHPGVWAKNSLKTFSDIAKTIGGKNTLNEVRADVLSRPNARNGMYDRMKVDVFGNKEEAFPTSLPERVPVAGRFFKASEAAFVGWQQRTRADLADKYLEIAQKTGVDLTSKKELTSIGNMVNSLTSRGHLGRVGERASKTLNNVFFSPRLLKSNFDVLTAHQLQGGVTPFVRKQAAINLVKIVGGTAGILALADAVKPGSVDYDPRSSNFGKIRVGDTRFDVSGGMAGLVTLAARFATASSKSSSTGEVKQLNTGEFGSQSIVDVLSDFAQNKLSPVGAVFRDYLRGQDFDGNKPTVASTAANLVTPLIYTTWQDTQTNPKSAPALAVLLADGLGLGANTYSIKTNWQKNPSSQLQGFKKKVGEDKFNKANTDYNNKFNQWFDGVKQDPALAKLSPGSRAALITAKRVDLQKEVLKDYGYEYKKPKPDDSNKKIIEELKKYR